MWVRAGAKLQSGIQPQPWSLITSANVVPSSTVLLNFPDGQLTQAVGFKAFKPLAGVIKYEIFESITRGGHLADSDLALSLPVIDITIPFGSNQSVATNSNFPAYNLGNGEIGFAIQGATFGPKTAHPDVGTQAEGGRIYNHHFGRF